MKPVIFYHESCLDGFAGAWAAWKKFGNRADYRALSHEITKAPTGIAGRDVYFIDYCLPEKSFARVLKTARHVTVIDHHITHRDVAACAEQCIFNVNKSGCVLAWNYFHPKKKVPSLLLTIQDNDLFTLKRKKTLEIVTALALAEHDFDSFDTLVHTFEKATVRRCLETLGSFLLQYKDVFVSRLLEIAEPVVFHGYRAYAVNTDIFYSEAGNRVYRTLHVPLGIAWHYKDGRMKVSLRSNGSIDCGALAARYGGGGHVGAAGFWIDFDGSFPWKKSKKKRG